MLRVLFSFLLLFGAAAAAETTQAKRTLGVLLFPGFEMLDAC